MLLCMMLAGCGGAQIKQQKAQIGQLQAQIRTLNDQLKDKDGQIAALQSAKTDLETKVKELGDTVASSQAQIDSLEKSNKDLSDSTASNKGELLDKVKKLVAEKDALARQLSEAQKAKAVLVARRERTLAELAKTKQERDDLAAKLAPLEAEKAAADKARSERLAKTHEEMGTLADSILKEIQAEQASIDQDSGRITIVLREPLLFQANQAKLTESGAALLDRLGAALKALPARDIHVQGHTDNAPIKWELFGRFTSHWDLSAAQAIAVARYLHEHAGLDPMKLLAEGYGEFRPLKPNDSPEGRAANRRIALVIEAP